MTSKIRGSLCMVAVLGLLCLPAFAEPATFNFYDQDGNLLQGIGVSAFTDNGSFKTAGEPSGNYVFDVAPGGKITINATNNQLGKYNTHTVILPVDLSQNISVTLFETLTQHLCAEGLAVDFGVWPGDTTGAGFDPNVSPGVCGTTITGGGDALWFDLTIPGVAGTDDRLVTASTCNDNNPATGSAQYDSKISVFCQDCDSADFTCVGGNDDGPGCAGFSSSFSWCARAESTYHILVHGFLGDAGAFELALVDGGAGSCQADDQCAPIIPPPPSGACCFDNCDILAGASQAVIDECAEFSCRVLTVDECMAAGGAYQGDDIPCVVLSDTALSFSDTPGVAIPDNDSDGVRTEIAIAGTGAFVGDLDVDLLINHTWIGDLLVSVTNKGTGTSVDIWNRNCGAGPTAGLDFLADDEGTQTFCGPTGGFTTGSIPPALVNGFTSFLSDFDGEPIDGTWSLAADDNFTADTGTINFWSLIFLTGTPTCPTECEGGGPGPGDDEDEDEDGDSGDMGPDVFVVVGQDQPSNDGLLGLDRNNNRTETPVNNRGTRTGRASGKSSR